MPTFTKRDWKRIRPNAAKGSGVGKGIDAVVKTQKKTGSIKDCTKALLAIGKLLAALRTGEDKAKNQGTREEQAAFKNTLTAWRRELSRIEATTKETRKGHCISELNTIGFNLVHPLGAQVIGVRDKLATFHRAEAAIEDPEARHKTEFEKIKSAANMVYKKAKPKMTRTGMRKHLTRLAGGYINKGMMTAADVPDDPRWRDELELHVRELLKELERTKALYPT